MESIAELEKRFARIPIEHARKALQNGLLNVSAIYHDGLVGMGRLVGDGAMYWYLQEIIVLPQFQRMGIGTMIVHHLVDYAKENSVTAWRKCGFVSEILRSWEFYFLMGGCM